MANRKLTELPTLEIAQFDSTDLLYIVDVATDTSNKITYAELVGNEIIRIDSTIEAFSAENVGDITFLSGAIDDNTGTITTLSVGANQASNAIDGLSAIIDVNFGLFELLSADVRDIDLVDLTSDVSTLCAYTNFFKEEIGDGLYDVKYAALTAYTYVTQVSALNLTLSGNKIGSANLDTTANTLATAVNELHGEIAAAIPLATLKTQTAASTDFADFKTRINAL